jgi:hypothetical protein
MTTVAPYVYQADRGLVWVYTCSVCGSRFEWVQGESSWYGSWKDLENGNWKKIKFACSHACKETLTKEAN